MPENDTKPAADEQPKELVITNPDNGKSITAKVEPEPSEDERMTAAGFRKVDSAWRR